MTPFTKLTQPTLKTMFVEQLEHLILSGTLAAGAKLPTERDLAESMQVSRTIVNSGIAELERKGFVRVEPRVGAFVTDYRRAGNLETLIAIMSYNGDRLRTDEIRSILEVRIALDNLALQLLIPKITDEEVEHLRLVAQRIGDASSDEEAIVESFAFQCEMAVLSGNVLIPLIFQSFKVPVFTLWDRACKLYGREVLYVNHQGLYERIADRDLEAATAWVEETINDFIDGKRRLYF
jgi:DNA-binding FadR family transcriptional regulator